MSEIERASLAFMVLSLGMIVLSEHDWQRFVSTALLGVASLIFVNINTRGKK